MTRNIVDRVGNKFQTAQVIKAPAADHDVVNKKYVDNLFNGALYSSESDRALDTIYQNENDFPIMVIVGLTLSVVITSTYGDGTSYAYGKNGSSSPPTTVCDHVNLDYYGNVGDEIFVKEKIIFIVPAGDYYEVVTDHSRDGNTPVLPSGSWTEFKLTTAYLSWYYSVD